MPMSEWERGIFPSLIRDPRLILLDAAANPGRYDEQTVELLERIQRGEAFSDLRACDQRLLNLASSEYLTTPSRPRRKYAAAQFVAPAKPRMPEAARELFFWLDQPLSNEELRG